MLKRVAERNDDPLVARARALDEAPHPPRSVTADEHKAHIRAIEARKGVDEQGNALHDREAADIHDLECVRARAPPLASHGEARIWRERKLDEALRRHPLGQERLAHTLGGGIDDLPAFLF